MSEGSLADFAPIVASVVSKREMIRSLLELYQVQGLPMGFVSGRAGGSIADLIDYPASADDLQPGVLVEWADAGRFAQSIAAARSATSLVLTRSAIKTLDDIRLLDDVEATYRLLAPRSLLRALEHELADAEKQVGSGQRTAYAGDHGFGLSDIPAGHPSLVGRAEATRRQFEFVHAAAILASRPLRSVRGPGREDLREAIGWDSYDAVALAEDGQGVLYADDIGLRMYSLSGMPAQSTSSLTLIPALVGRGRLTADAGDKAVATLIVRRYVQARPYPGLLSSALQPQSGFDLPKLRRIFVTLADPGLPVVEAVELAALAIREAAIGPGLVVVSTPTVVELALEALSGRVRVQVACQLLADRLRVHLRLVPQRLDPLLSLLKQAEGE